jgi:uncharacterized protein (UPF0212 family)
VPKSAADAQEESVADLKCPHCGAAKEPVTISRNGTTVTVEMPSHSAWLCSKCERWTNTTSCPTCGQPVTFDALAERQKGE